MTKKRPQRVIRTTQALAFVVILAGCESVPYAVQPEEARLLPPEMAVDFLRSLPAGSNAVALRPEEEHCEFRRGGLRVAAANPTYVQRMVDAQRVELGKAAREKEATEREQRRVEEAQRDRLRWMRANGFGDLADEQRWLDNEHQSPERWLQARAHEPASYERAAFVVYRRLRGDMHLDIEYEVPQAGRVEGCGMHLNPSDPETPKMIQRIATALAALGVEPQSGVKAEPPVGEGRRYTAPRTDFSNLARSQPTGSD